MIAHAKIVNRVRKIRIFGVTIERDSHYTILSNTFLRVVGQTDVIGSHAKFVARLGCDAEHRATIRICNRFFHSLIMRFAIANSTQNLIAFDNFANVFCACRRLNSGVRRQTLIVVANNANVVVLARQQTRPLKLRFVHVLKLVN